MRIFHEWGNSFRAGARTAFEHVGFEGLADNKQASGLSCARILTPVIVEFEEIFSRAALAASAEQGADDLAVRAILNAKAAAEAGLRDEGCSAEIIFVDEIKVAARCPRQDCPTRLPQ